VAGDASVWTAMFPFSVSRRQNGSISLVNCIH
jgi:hypothetical protein